MHIQIPCVGKTKVEMNPNCDHVWRNARLLTMAGDQPAMGRVEDGLVASKDGRIVYAGSRSKAPFLKPSQETDCGGRWITPGLIDCHTHLVFGGDRAREFELRLAGSSYEEIARAGGGIASTVLATRQASAEMLNSAALARLDALLAEGVTTVEIKSGYGLSLADEVRQLGIARGLADQRPVSIITTFLGAHALPPEAEGDKDRYIDLVCKEMIPFVARAKLADAVDAFCEGIGFSPEQVGRVMSAAKARGLKTKLHADQLSNLSGAKLAADFGSLSADHLEHTDEAGVAAMAAAGVCAVLLPGAFYFMRETRRPPIDLLRSHGVPMAIATDCNPGTSPLTSLLLTMNMAATLFQMTVEECLAGVTRQAARALGLQDEVGALEVGKRCDLAIWDIEQPAELVYRIGFNPLWSRVWNGQ
jgi:imidazolonepropionase